MDYIYTLHIKDIERSFTDFFGSGRRLLFHLPRDVISDNEEYKAFLEISHMCADGVSTSHFTLSKIHMHACTVYTLYLRIHYIIVLVSCSNYMYTLLYFYIESPDIETVTADVVSGGIAIEATLVTGSSALGCFVVVQCDKSTSDHYFALPRDGDSLILSDMIHVPSMQTPYTVIVYNVQQNRLPNDMPAIIFEVSITDSGMCLVQLTNDKQ